MSREWLAETDEEMLCIDGDGYDDAIIGYVEQFGRPPIALYDKELLLAIMVEREGMAYEDAIEHYEYNIFGSWVGDYTPAFAVLIEREIE
jgi:hypothetical protein